MKSFKVWITQEHRETNAPIGDLARDIKDDYSDFPVSTKRGKNLGRLLSRGACCDTVNAFNDAWRLYASLIF